MNEPLFLDANIPMYATGGESPYRAACRRLLRDITEERLHVVTDTEIIQEILYRYSALRRWETGLTMAASLLQIVPKVLPVRREDMEQMLLLGQQYHQHGIQPRDLIHAAVMQNHGIRQIISADRHFDFIEGIERVDPLDLATR